MDPLAQHLYLRSQVDTFLEAVRLGQKFGAHSLYEAYLIWANRTDQKLVVPDYLFRYLVDLNQRQKINR